MNSKKEQTGNPNMKLFNDEIKTLSVDCLVPNKINPNTMSVSTFKKLQFSLKKFGQLQPIIVRPLEVGPNDIGTMFEIVDGEYRWKAAKEIGLPELQVRIIEATDDEVRGLIFASTIKGKHDIYEVVSMVKELSETEDNASLQAMNLDKNKIERKIKYHEQK
jgi:ParB-like chromosome segregation protein Spo0J